MTARQGERMDPYNQQETWVTHQEGEDVHTPNEYERSRQLCTSGQRTPSWRLRALVTPQILWSRRSTSMMAEGAGVAPPSPHMQLQQL